MVKMVYCTIVVLALGLTTRYFLTIFEISGGTTTSHFAVELTGFFGITMIPLLDLD